MSTVYIRSQL